MIATNSLIICPKEIQRLILKYRFLNPRENFSFISLEDLQGNFFGETDDQTLKFLLKNSNHDLINILSELEYIKKGINVDCDDDIKKTYELISKNHLIYKDSYISQLLKINPVSVLGYSKHNVELKHILDIVGITPTYLSIDDFLTKEEKTIYSFESIDQELRYVFNIMLNDDASRIINFEKPRNKVLVCDTTSYESLIKMFAPEFGIKYRFKNKKSVKETAIGKEMLSRCLKNDNLVEFLSSEETLTKYQDKDSISILLNLVTTFDVDNLNDKYNNLSILLDRIVMDKPIVYEGEILIQNEIGFDPNVDYYVIGASDSFLPMLVSNNGYFDDSILKDNYINTSEVKNIEIEELTKAFIESTLVKFISYHIVEGKNKLYHTTFVTNEALLEPLKYSYSKSISKAYYSKAYDVYKKYHEETHDLIFGKKDDLVVFDNTFTGIDRGDLSKKDISLSYTSLQEYQTCPFKYYCDHVLGISEFNESYASKKGTFAHKVFEYISRTDFDTALDTAKGQLDYDNSFTEKEKLLLEGMIPNLRYSYNQLKERIYDSGYFKDFCFEYGKKVDGTLNKIKVDEHIYLSGAIDNICITNNDEIVIIDYKTGSFNIPDSLNANLGLNLQVLVYTFILKNSDEFKDKKIAGTYYQRVHSKVLDNTSKNYKDEFALEGFNYSDTFMNDINALPNWFKLHDQFMSVEETYDLVKNKITEAANKIRNNEFGITPIKIYNKKGSEVTDGCKYCPFTSICYRKPFKEQANNQYKESEESK